MFRGNHPTRVDEKGRLKVPAEFKRLIDEKYGTQFYITSLDGKVAQVYPFEEWQRIEEKLARLSNFNPTKKKFLNRTNYYGQQVEIDGQSRLLIPALLRDSAGIKGEVAVVGNLTYLEVQSIEAYKKDIDDLRESPALTIIELLQKEGVQVSYNDPFFPTVGKGRKYDLQMKCAPLDNLGQYDCVLIVTDHSDYDYRKIVQESKLVVDTRNATRGIESSKIVHC